ncbi:hypothetical protein M8J77_021618 [Diaphorina citri]|nr:hypothetical protein M8J77_021618 [Diaphorina citri]
MLDKLTQKDSRACNRPGLSNLRAPEGRKRPRRAFAGRKNELAGRMRPAGRGLDKPVIDRISKYLSIARTDMSCVLPVDQ